MQNTNGIGIAIGKFSYQKSVQTTLPSTLQGLNKHVSTIEWARRKNQTGFPPNDASIYQLEASRQVGGFDTTIEGASEDEDIILRLKNHGWSIALNEKAEFYALSRETWQGLWKENVWFGYGKHFLSHKYKEKNFFLRYLPLIYVYIGLKQSLSCYRLTQQKNSFLLPLLGFFNTTSLYFGFIKAHKDGYGHKKNK
jgi:cellulose synthase/poly-beta-1,6-N-acetylglucosamine synthase-like glycosyltransferase